MTEKKMLLPTDSQQRKAIPITEGVLDYFPLAIAEVAKCSHAGNQQHHPDKPLHWDRSKSTDHANCISRHLIDRGSVDTDGVRHSAKLAWRALALLQTELEAVQSKPVDSQLDTAPEHADWVPHFTGARPDLPPDTLVELLLGGGGCITEQEVRDFDWANTEGDDDKYNIIAYRIVK